MNNYYAPCIYRVDFVVIPSCIELLGPTFVIEICYRVNKKEVTKGFVEEIHGKMGSL